MGEKEGQGRKRGVLGLGSVLFFVGGHPELPNPSRTMDGLMMNGEGGRDHRLVSRRME